MAVLSRRSLFVGASAVGVATVLAPQARGAAPTEAPPTQGSPTAFDEAEATLMRSHFTPGLGKVFRAAGLGAQHELTLVEIADLAPLIEADREHSFNLIFVSAAGSPTEGLYKVSHRDVRAAYLYLSPVDLPNGSQSLQALFNRAV